MIVELGCVSVVEHLLAYTRLLASSVCNTAREVHIHMHTCMYTCTHMHTCIHIYTHIHMHTHMHTYTSAFAPFGFPPHPKM